MNPTSPPDPMVQQAMSQMGIQPQGGPPPPQGPMQPPLQGGPMQPGPNPPGMAPMPQSPSMMPPGGSANPPQTNPIMQMIQKMSGGQGMNGATNPLMLLTTLAAHGLNHLLGGLGGKNKDNPLGAMDKTMSTDTDNDGK